VAVTPAWAPGPVRPTLRAGDVHVWLGDLDVRDSERARVYLSPDESARADGFCFARDRHRYAAARGLLREMLALYLDLEPEAVRFAYGPRGKPALASATPDALRFNVSHSGGLAILAFALGREVGVDIEVERPLADAETIAARFFSRREASELMRLPEPERQAAFFRCWTRKEAFIKATGDGLSRPLDAFDVEFRAGEPARLLRVEGDLEAAQRFYLLGLEPAPGFAAALAVERRPRRVERWTWDGTQARDGARRETRRRLTRLS